MNLRFAAHDLRPNIEVLYDKRFKAVGDTKATNIDETLKEWTPEGVSKHLLKGVLRGRQLKLQYSIFREGRRFQFTCTK